jgi:hypothetical protein
VQPVGSVIGFASLASAIVALTVQFYFSGMAVTIALTRTRAAIGRLYAWDLAGAAFGCLAVVPLLDSGWFNLSSLVLLGAAVASGGGWCFGQAFGGRYRPLSLLVAILLAAAAMTNGARGTGLEIAHKEPSVLDVRAHRSDLLEQPLLRGRAAAGPVGTVPLGRRPPGSRRAGERGLMVIDGEAVRRSPSGTAIPPRSTGCVTT